MAVKKPHELDEHRDYIVKRTKQCATRPEIARELGVDASRLINYCKMRKIISTKTVMAENDKFLKANYGEMSIKEMADATQMSRSLAERRLSAMGLIKRSRYSKKEPLSPREVKYNKLLVSEWVSIQGGELA